MDSSRSPASAWVEERPAAELVDKTGCVPEGGTEEGEELERREPAARGQGRKSWVLVRAEDTGVAECERQEEGDENQPLAGAWSHGSSQ